MRKLRRARRDEAIAVPAGLLARCFPQQRQRDQFACFECVHEAHLVIGGRYPTTGRGTAPRQLISARLQRTVLALRIALGNRGHLLRRRIARCGHARRSKDVLGDIVVVALPTYLLDQRPKQHEAVIGIFEPGARRELRGTLPVELDQIRDRANPGAVGTLFRLQYTHVSGTPLVRKQLPNGDLRHILVWIVDQVLSNGIIEAKLARFDELQHRDGREHLALRREQERGIPLHRRSASAVGQSEIPAVQPLAILLDHQHPGEPISCGQARGESIECLQRVCLGHAYGVLGDLFKKR